MPNSKLAFLCPAGAATCLRTRFDRDLVLVLTTLQDMNGGMCVARRFCSAASRTCRTSARDTTARQSSSSALPTTPARSVRETPRHRRRPTRRTSSRVASCAVACRLPSLPPPRRRRRVRVPTPLATRHSSGCSAPRVAHNALPRARARPHADNASNALVRRADYCRASASATATATASLDLTSAFVSLALASRFLCVCVRARMRRPSRAVQCHLLH